MNPFDHRLANLRRSMKNLDVDALIIGYSENILYLTGFSGSEGWLVVSKSQAYLIVDSRYYEQAALEVNCTGLNHVQLKSPLEQCLLSLFRDHRFKTIGFEEDHLNYLNYKKLQDALRKEGMEFGLTPCKNAVEALRAIKDTEEIAKITESARLSDIAFNQLLTLVRPGITEHDLAWQLERHLRENGSENLPFQVIVCSGPQTSMPHGRPGARKLISGDPVLIDFGARFSGYCSDMTRTLFVGKIDDIYKKAYDIVLAAQLTATACIKAGISGREADAYARKIIEEAGYADLFSHGLGHGLGLEVHESPRLGVNSTDILAENMVFTIEPGIYIQGLGGIRIEDTVVLQNNEILSLNKSEKSLICV